MDRTRVLLLFGGESSEHDVSISSAQNVHAAMNKDAYDITLCYISPDGRWWRVDEVKKEKDIQDRPQLLPALGTGTFMVAPGDESLAFDVILPILHGRNGEDGTVQGLAQLMHIPIVGCDVTASGTAMNKLACKEVLAANDIPVTPYQVHRAYEEIPPFADITEALGDTVFVKPARAGSSVGVSKVKNEEEFAAALDEAHRHDPIALIERAIIGHELEVAVLGTPPHHKVSGVGEILPGEDFYTYDDKYAADSKAQVNLESNVDENIKQRVRDIALSAFEILDCRGLARIDYVLNDEGELYVMEVNTMPGFTNISMYPKLWQKEGIEYPQLIDQLIKDALTNK